MSKKLGIITLAMAILVGAMGLKTIVTANASGNTGLFAANGGAPLPLPIKQKPPTQSASSKPNN
jgi:hypothetical protein